MMRGDDRHPLQFELEQQASALQMGAALAQQLAALVAWVGQRKAVEVQALHVYDRPRHLRSLDAAEMALDRARLSAELQANRRAEGLGLLDPLPGPRDILAIDVLAGQVRDALEATRTALRALVNERAAPPCDRTP